MNDTNVIANRWIFQEGEVRKVGSVIQEEGATLSSYEVVCLTSS